MRSILTFGFLLVLAALATADVRAQGTPKTVFLDSDGNSVSNNEFVDIRMANFHYKDATLVRTLEDGTVEFRLQKVPQEGMAAPVIAAKTIDGKAIRPEDLKGKVVVLNFWFIGCAVCRSHHPKLNDLKAKFAGRDDVVFLAATFDTEGDVKKYLAKEKFDYMQVADADPLLKTFRFSGYPRNIVVSRTGEIVYWRTSITAWDKFESVIRNELAK